MPAFLTKQRFLLMSSRDGIVVSHQGFENGIDKLVAAIAGIGKVKTVAERQAVIQRERLIGRRTQACTICKNETVHSASDYIDHDFGSGGKCQQTSLPRKTNLLVMAAKAAIHDNGTLTQ